jgi:hypothetical protein
LAYEKTLGFIVGGFIPEAFSRTNPAWSIKKLTTG